MKDYVIVTKGFFKGKILEVVEFNIRTATVNIDGLRINLPIYDCESVPCLPGNYAVAYYAYGYRVLFIEKYVVDYYFDEIFAIDSTGDEHLLADLEPAYEINSLAYIKNPFNKNDETKAMITKYNEDGTVLVDIYANCTDKPIRDFRINYDDIVECYL